MITLFEQYRNKEQLKIEILDYLRLNTNLKDKLCVDTQTIAYSIRISIFRKIIQLNNHVTYLKFYIHHNILTELSHHIKNH